MPAPVFYNVCSFGTGSIETGAGNITITNGIAVLTIEQTGNIGVGVAIEYNSLIAYVAPNRIGFDSGGTTELLIDTKIEGGTSGATGIVRFVELLSGTWGGGDAAGWIYFEKTTGTFQDDEQINRTKPTTSSNIATIDGTIEGNIGNGNTEFVVKSAVGADAVNQGETAVTSIHHEYASLSAFEAGFIDANHINDTDLTNADVVAHACCYYDHDDYTVDSANANFTFGTASAVNRVVLFCPKGGAESINVQSSLGKYETNKYLLQGYLAVYEDGFWIDGLQIVDSGTVVYHGQGTGAKIVWSNCFIKCTDDSRVFHIADPGGASTFLMHNCVIVSGGTSGEVLLLEGANWTFHIHNVTSIGGAYCYNVDDDASLKNCLGHGSGTLDFREVAATLTCNYCASEDGSADDYSGANNRVDQTFTFTDSGDDDYSLASNDAGARDHGVVLTADANLPVWRDASGNEYGATPDIGAFEYVAAGTTTTTTISTTSSSSSSTASTTSTISTTSSTVSSSSTSSTASTTSSSSSTASTTHSTTTSSHTTTSSSSSTISTTSSTASTISTTSSSISTTSTSHSTTSSSSSTISSTSSSSSTASTTSSTHTTTSSSISTTSSTSSTASTTSSSSSTISTTSSSSTISTTSTTEPGVTTHSTTTSSSSTSTTASTISTTSSTASTISTTSSTHSSTSSSSSTISTTSTTHSTTTSSTHTTTTYSTTSSSSSTISTTSSSMSTTSSTQSTTSSSSSTESTTTSSSTTSSTISSTSSSSSTSSTESTTSTISTSSSSTTTQTGATGTTTTSSSSSSSTTSSTYIPTEAVYNFKHPEVQTNFKHPEVQTNFKEKI